MAPATGMTEGEAGTWIVRVGMFVIGFFLCLGVRDAKKSLDEIPALKAQVAGMKEAQDVLFRKIEALENRK